VAVFVAASSVCACDETPTHPAMRDAAGTYRLTMGSENFLEYRKHYASHIPVCEIELHPDSTVEIRNLPDCAVSDRGKPNGKYVDRRGRWDLAGGLLGIQYEGGAGTDYGIEIWGEKPPYHLEITLGDGDNHETLRYDRVR